MKNILQEKLSQNQSTYNQAELAWCLENIGHWDPDIRDNLVYLSFCKMLDQESLSVEQFQLLGHWCREKRSLFAQLDKHGEATLKRSFTALLQTLLLWADAREGSIYKGQLDEQPRSYLLQSALDYLQVEKDDTAFHSEYGWVHAFAHGADLLAEAVVHPDFSMENFQQVLEILEYLFKNRSRRFLGDEELRLAVVVTRPILSGKVKIEPVLGWLEQLNLPLESDLDYDRRLSFRLFALTIYVDLDQAQKLDQSAKETLYKWIAL
ncbi:DUF2785 domain-containing protein [Streptococcus merionis]|uniref:DUF2785 domain-containing protein n=1 Tax=Streptococcus merionis TaxID=400065 RepID=UPI0026ECFE66|nr:DUF2785 domain-containing protein [Streptococcus merionis]